jgi:hypothetical protein
LGFADTPPALLVKTDRLAPVDNRITISFA